MSPLESFLNLSLSKDVLSIFETKRTCPKGYEHIIPIILKIFTVVPIFYILLSSLPFRNASLKLEDQCTAAAETVAETAAARRCDKQC